MNDVDRITSGPVVPPLGVKTGTINLSERVADGMIKFLEENKVLTRDTFTDWEMWVTIFALCGKHMTNISEVVFSSWGGKAVLSSPRAKLTIRPIGVKLPSQPVSLMACVLEANVRSDATVKTSTGKVVDVSTIDGVKEIITAVAQL